MTSTTEPSSAAEPALEVVPYGGLGEFGMNMMLVTWRDTAILIDAGAMFPGPELPGVDLVIPDLGHLQERVGRLSAVVLTHGHEDHIGALPYVWPLVDGPVYGTPLTLALAGHKLEEHGFDPDERCRPLHAGDTAEIGDVTLELIRVTHSMPDCVAVALHTPAGVIVAQRRLQDRSDAARRSGPGRPPVRGARTAGGARLLRRQHQHRAPGVHGGRKPTS